MVAVTPSRPGAASSNPRRPPQSRGSRLQGRRNSCPCSWIHLFATGRDKEPGCPHPVHPKGTSRPIPSPPAPILVIFFPPFPGFFASRHLASPSSPASPHKSHPICPQPGRGSRRAGCPRRRPRSSAGSTRRGLRSAGQRGGTVPGLAPHNSPGVGSRPPKTPAGAPGLRISAPKCFETLGLGFQHPKTRLGAIGLGFRAPKTKPEAPKLGFGTPRMETQAPGLGFGAPK